MKVPPALNRRGHMLLHFGTFSRFRPCGARKSRFAIFSYRWRISHVPNWKTYCPQKKNVPPARPLSFQDKLRRNTMLAIPLTIVAASISAAVYMAFGWRPPEPKRVRHFFYEKQSNRWT
jgi:hypothetical protein